MSLRKLELGVLLRCPLRGHVASSPKRIRAQPSSLACVPMEKGLDELVTGAGEKSPTCECIVIPMLYPLHWQDRSHAP
jgi:hypothetical protein